MAKKKAKRGAAKKAAKKARKKSKRPKRTEVESHVDAKMAKMLDDAKIAGGFVNFQVHGDSVGGTILSIETVKGRWGPKQHVTVETSDGTKTFGCTTLLEKYFEEHKVKVGDTVAVRYCDDAPTNKGNDAKLFKIVHQPAKGKKRK
jgi:hypothetical protein